MHERALVFDRFLNLLESPQEVLIVGCSVKADVLAMMQQGIEVIGIEPCNTLIGENSQSVSTGMLRRMDVRRIKYPRETFTGIWVSLPLNHASDEDISSILKEFWRVLKPDGVLSINVEEDQDKNIDHLRIE